MDEVTLPEVTETQSGTEDKVTPTDQVAPPTSEENHEESDTEESKKPTGFQRRVQKFQAQLTQKEAELEYWRNEALKKSAPPEAPRKAPALADFNSVEEYIAAREKQMKEELLEEVRRTSQQQVRTTRVEAEYAQRVSAARSELPDWNEVMELAADEPTAPETVQFCMDSEVGPRIAYHLAKHPEEHERINAMSPIRRVAELGKLEEKLSRKEAPRTTKAPEKLSSVKGGTVVSTDPGEAARTGGYAAWKAAKAAKK